LTYSGTLFKINRHLKTIRGDNIKCQNVNMKVN
jgi:hypothetical protein